MKIIFLNAWRGQIPQVKDFILEHIKTTDIFCLQEAGFSKNSIFCQDYLSPQYIFFTESKILTTDDTIVQATFVKKQHQVLNTQLVCKEEKNIGLGLFTQIKSSNNKIFNVLNFHGTAWPANKRDDPNRLKQSKLIIDFMSKFNENKIIGGDFNLNPDTKSVTLFEQKLYLNLIKKFEIKSTRNEIAWADYSVEQRQSFADFVFISTNLKIKSFTVPYNEISDHLPLILEMN
jgi:endonuclease/exonuclease/phosphatase (EEP) superfamily protein YafD